MMWEKDTVEHYTRIMLEEDAAAGSPLVQAARAGRGPQAVIHAWEGFVMPRALTVAKEEGVAGLSMLLRALRV